jgi:hypothetical protein
VRVLLGLLPAATCAPLTFALRPAGPVFGSVRLSMVRAALATAGVAAVLVEALSAAHDLTPAAMVLSWSAAAVLAGAAATVRHRRDRRGPAVATGPTRPRMRAAWTAWSRAERTMALALLLLVLAELVVAVASPPNNFDSQTYHLPRIEHWVAQRSVRFFPTEIDRQVSMAPGAEYLLLHLRLLTGGDALDNLLQFWAGVGCLLLASRIAGQLGGSRRAQLLAALVAGTAPIVTLESTSTQTDLVTAAWVGSLATLVLDELRRRTRPRDLVVIGAAAGMCTLTKATGLLAAATLLMLWVVAQLRLAGAVAGPARARRVAGTAAGGLLILVCVAVLAGPFLSRENTQFGNPLGPSGLRTSVTLQRHDPGSVFVNALRIGYTALDTPIAPLDATVSHGITRLSHAIGVNPNDPQTTFVRSTFPTVNWAPDEDRASLPVAGTLILLGAGFLLIRPHRRVPATHAVPVRAYAAVFWVNVLLYVATIRWQPWGNRLVLYLVVLGAPLSGLWLDAVLRGRRRPAHAAASAYPTAAGRATRLVAAGTVAVAVAASVCAGWLAVGYGWPRRLVGAGSVFTVSDMPARFQRRPHLLADYEWAAAAVRASGSRRVGLVQTPDAWEYPWWVLLPGRDIVALQSVVPGLPPVRPEQVDAIVCEVPASQCLPFVPPGWQLHERDDTGYVLPPANSPESTSRAAASR